jgi:gamma-glutamylcyclotransferase (GGCT)/AIG2-like uncharacterized protein YtfP
MSDYLFVYGTLRQTSNNPKAAALHARAKLIGEGWVTGRLYKISWYPALKLEKDGQPVYGDIYQLEEPVKTELLKDMDAYEGIAGGQPDMSEYSRVLTKVHTPNGHLKCWTYQYNWDIPLDAEVFESGDFLNP